MEKTKLERYIKETKEKYMPQIKKLYDYINHIIIDDEDYDTIANDIGYDYLTEITGRDKNIYLWFMYENINCLINVETMTIIDDEQTIEKLFY